MITRGRVFDKSRLRLGIVIALVCGALTYLLLQGLSSATTYFRNADEAMAEYADLGTKRFRLQGTVVPGTVAAADGSVTFDVVYNCSAVSVLHRGDPPELFKPGIPVVLEGAFAAPADDAASEGSVPVYLSDTIFVRHTNEYRSAEGDRIEAANAETSLCP